MNKFKVKNGYINLDNISYIDLQGDRVYFVGGIDDYIILEKEDMKNLSEFLESKNEPTPIYIRKDSDSYTLNIKNVDLIANILENIK